MGRRCPDPSTAPPDSAFPGISGTRWSGLPTVRRPRPPRRRAPPPPLHPRRRSLPPTPNRSLAYTADGTYAWGHGATNNEAREAALSLLDDPGSAGWSVAPADQCIVVAYDPIDDVYQAGVGPTTRDAYNQAFTNAYKNGSMLSVRTQHYLSFCDGDDEPQRLS